MSLRKIGDNHHVAVAGVVAVQPYRVMLYGMDMGSGGVRITYSSGAVVTLPGITVEIAMAALYGREKP